MKTKVLLSVFLVVGLLSLAWAGDMRPVEVGQKLGQIGWNNTWNNNIVFWSRVV